MIEIISSGENLEVNLGDVEGHYSDTKYFLGSDIDEALKFMEEFLGAILDQNISLLIQLLAKLNITIESLESSRSA